MSGELRRDVLLPLIVLIGVLLLTSAGTVALLARMAPAIERILDENLYSLTAAEEMEAALCADRDDPATRDRFAAALARAEGNVTEESERAELATLHATWAQALAGDPAARQRAREALDALGAINRSAVVRRDEEAKRLGYAGAWAAVFLGALCFAWGLIAVRRARRRMIEPLREIREVLVAAHAGDSYRRCQRMPAPAEVHQIMAGIDDLLDALALRGFAGQPPLRAVHDRQMLLHLLEQRSGPAWMVCADGAVDAANRAGLAALAGGDSQALRRALAAAAAGGDASGMRVEAIEGTDRLLCEPERAAPIAL